MDYDELSYAAQCIGDHPEKLAYLIGEWMKFNKRSAIAFGGKNEDNQGLYGTIAIIED